MTSTRELWVLNLKNVVMHPIIRRGKRFVRGGMLTRPDNKAQLLGKQSARRGMLKA